MAELDRLLNRVRDLPADPRLATLDDGVFAGIQGLAAPQRLGGSAFALAFAIALTVGVLGSALPTSPAQAAPLDPLGAPSALAPSSLLDGSGE